MIPKKTSLFLVPLVSHQLVASYMYPVVRNLFVGVSYSAKLPRSPKKIVAVRGKMPIFVAEPRLPIVGTHLINSLK